MIFCVQNAIWYFKQLVLERKNCVVV